MPHNSLLLLSLLANLAYGRITGFHVDDETCSGLLANNKTRQEVVCRAFFGSLANLSGALHQYSTTLRGPPLTLTVDAGTAWSCTGQQTNCFNLTYNGTSQSVANHVVDLASQVILMDYDRSSDSAVQRALPYLEYADRVGGGVAIGLAIAGPHGQPAPWQTRNESELHAVMTASTPKLSKHPSFQGFSVFTEGTWRSNSQQLKATDLTWPNDTGVWYLDHDLVLNETQRAGWLGWAEERNIGAIFIAPHAGARALISIPGVEGSAADDVKFCDFIHQADAKGIDVQLISDPLTDIAFIRNCSARGVRL